MTAITIGTADVIRRGSNIAILAFGSVLHACSEVAAHLGATLVNMRFVKPLDTELITQMANTHSLLVTVEENALAGGAGSGVNESLSAAGQLANLLNIGLPDRFIEHGAREDCLAMAGLDSRGILDQINSRLQHLHADSAVVSSNR